jgi:protein-S-isoprenylcysteine O-methyltransferase Ste14
MHKLNFLGIGPIIALLAFPWLAGCIVLTFLYPSTFTCGPMLRYPLYYTGLAFFAIGFVLYLITATLLLDGLRHTKLITTGTYKYCRNPLYAIIILLIFPGIAFFLNSWIILTTSIVAYVAFMRFIKSEDDEMESFFGDAYRKYRDSTPAFFPFVKP